MSSSNRRTYRLLIPDAEPTLDPQKSSEDEEDVQTQLTLEEVVRRTGTASCQLPGE